MRFRTDLILAEKSFYWKIIYIYRSLFGNF